VCNATSCGGGCCSGTTCTNGFGDSTCGSGGAGCSDCTTIPSQICLSSGRTCGCSAGDDPWGTTCGGATDLGNFGQNSSQTISGRLRTGDNWFRVNFPTPPTPNGGFHPVISISSNDNSYRFEVRVGSCTGGAWACRNEGGSAGQVTSWDVQGISGRTDGLRCGAGCGPQKCICNSCTACSATGYTATPAVGVVFIHVFRPAGPACIDYNLTISD
jgi:hypothetical protein